MSSPLRSLVLIVLLGWTALPTTVAAPRPAQIGKDLYALWSDLLSTDELTATRATLALAKQPNDAVRYLKEKLKPLKLSKGRAEQLLEKLGSADEKAVRTAFGELTYFDPRLVFGDKYLRQVLLDKRPGSLLSRRLGAVLCDLPVNAFTRGKWHWYSPDNEVYRFNCGEAIVNRDAAIEVAGVAVRGPKSSWTRAVRAIAVLEHIGTPGAVAILKDMTTGHPDAAPTKAAKIVMKRLRKS